MLPSAWTGFEGVSTRVDLVYLRFVGVRMKEVGAALRFFDPDFVRSSKGFSWGVDKPELSRVSNVVASVSDSGRLGTCIAFWATASASAMPNA